MADTVPPSFPAVSSRDTDPFVILGIVPEFNIDPQRLRGAWMRLAMNAHPDGLIPSDDSDALSGASIVNRAYQTLRDPLARAVVLLEHFNAPASPANALPSNFLVELMELRERADAVHADHSAMRALRIDVAAQRADAIASIAAGFAAHAHSCGPMTADIAHDIRMQLNVTRSLDRVLEQLDRESGTGEP